MQLRTLSLVGFKSFADRTRLHFDSGVNVVVGPNGSGKSNLLDALAWVMGTQATKSLRTESMGDVIFAGTTTRPAMQRSEVNLTFDNSDHFLPIELPEVTITRRLYRDGTSEYEINGTSCRLLDIQELLSDGGVGRHQHVLVGQGQIGEILNARADEHRLVIEEAAGITKHRGRRDRALRRLEKTGIDIDRLRDILSQHERRLRPLKRQANAAERYDEVRSEVLALRLWLGGEELRRIRSRMKTATTEHDELQARLDSDVAEREELTDTLERLRGEAGEVGRALERDTAAAARLETVIERLQRISGIARERRRSLTDRHEGATARRSDLEDERASIRAELGEAATQSADAAALAERRGVALRALEDEERALAEQLQMPAEGLIATLRGDLRALETAAERDRIERESLERRTETVRDRLDHERAESAELQRQIEALDADVGAATDVYRTAAKRREEAEVTFDRAADAVNAAEVDLARATARHEAIEAALSGILDHEVTETALAHDGVVGTVVSRLDVPEGLAGAVDAALGSWRTGLAASSRDSAADAVYKLKSRGLGGVGLVGVAGAAGEVPARVVAARWGVPALVDMLGEGADAALAAALLGDVIVVEGWSAAIRIVDEVPGVRAVTPEGDLVTSEGFVLASIDGAGPAALEAAGVAIEEAEHQVARARSSYTTAQREFQGAHDAEREAAETLESVESRLAGSTEALLVFGRSIAAAEAELSRLDERSKALLEAGAFRDERLSQLGQRIADLEGEEAERHEAWEALNRRREDVARRREEARRLREEAAAASAGIEERRRLLSDRLATIESELATPDEVEIDPGVIERLATIEDQARATVDECRRHVAHLRHRQRELRETAGVADSNLSRAYDRAEHLDDAISQARSRLSGLEIELAELRVRHEATCEGLRRDADADESAALEAQRPEVPEDEDPKERLATVEAKLRRMGPINPLAATEYRELAEQTELLKSQLEDLEQSKRELRKVISALDEEMAISFREAFSDISRMYEENFALVFPGGKGSLRLTDPDRPLESGVEIEAQPLGKKVGRLSLLSGGERSLAALAFLFAVFRARPSPFYVLDEVEAALDDANLRRFLRLVDTLGMSTQLVIITHQQQTMEAADVLYGVTMEPGESSIVVSKRLGETADVAPAPVTST